ncbi:MAG TPA: hypothetical protein VNX68_05420, partial [Nitrosopumilaceae archaeon]|nr:hypothetical protein [Nitrosopumilaceae archaeon]
LDAEAKAKADAEAKAKAEAEAKAKAEADAKAKTEADARAKAKIELQYKSSITRGDNDMKLKKYAEAKDAYNEALTYKPGDAYATGKLADAEKRLKSDSNTKVVVDKTEKAPHPLLAKYGQGVTEESKNEPGVYIVTRVVVKDKDAWVYTKKIFNWGGVAFFKDGTPITESTYELETK